MPLSHIAPMNLKSPVPLAKQSKEPGLIRFSIATADGEFGVGYSALGLESLFFPEQVAWIRLAPAPTASPTLMGWHEMTTCALRSALTGEAVDRMPPLDLGIGTVFQKKVWESLGKIPRGRTQTYGEIAAGLGSPGAARAVGAACGANPLPVLIPCHRVLAARGELGGFSGGNEWKRKLMARESSVLG